MSVRSKASTQLQRQSKVLADGPRLFRVEWISLSSPVSTCLGVGLGLFLTRRLEADLAAWYAWCFANGGTQGIVLAEVWYDWISAAMCDGHEPKAILPHFEFYPL